MAKHWLLPVIKILQNYHRLVSGARSPLNFFARVIEKRGQLARMTITMGPTGDFTGVSFRRYAGMVDRMKYLEDIDENSAFYAYMEPYPGIKGMGYPRIAILKLVNRGISIIKVNEAEWPNKPARYQQFKETMVTPYSDYWLNKDPYHYDKYDFEQMLTLTRSHLLSRMNRVDINADPTWVYLAMSNYYGVFENEKVMLEHLSFYSNF